ncbi:MAG TPA: DUF3152 domain-containing protein [Mycobacteriales bacterium]|nr:DUF3152 domain-containing protein [Mycobacteriales bacterium]
MFWRRVGVPGLALAAVAAGYGLGATPARPPAAADIARSSADSASASPQPRRVPGPPLPPPVPVPPAIQAPMPAAPARPQTPPSVVTVRYRVEVRTGGEAVQNFAGIVDQTLTDARGWRRARFRLVRDDAAPYTVILAEAAEVDRLCLPYDTFGKYSCQNGPVVAINADRWRTATPKWTGDLATYRQMLINHEVGHLLGQHHPAAPQCAVPGRPALLMSQQSTELNGCLPNPWPRGEEIARAARHDEPLAPPYAD